MSTLSDRRHWDLVHQGEEHQTWQVPGDGDQRSTRLRNALRTIKRLLGSRLVGRMAAYDEYLLWDCIFRRYLPEAELRGRKVLEVGSAPGHFLVKFGQTYRCVPYGVDYSEQGVALNKRVFEANGFDPANVFHADVFSDEFQARYKGAFQVVVSRGFLEHFTDPERVIDRHASLVAPGGYLIVTIPNLRGANYALVRLFHKEVLAIHNLRLMRKETFAKVLDRPDLKPIVCDYYGTFSLALVNVKAGSPMRHVLTAMQKLQPLISFLCRSLFRDRGAESRWFSPALIFIGKKASI